MVDEPPPACSTLGDSDRNAQIDRVCSAEWSSEVGGSWCRRCGRFRSRSASPAGHLDYGFDRADLEGDVHAPVVAGDQDNVLRDEFLEPGALALTVYSPSFS